LVQEALIARPDTEPAMEAFINDVPLYIRRKNLRSDTHIPILPY
jgi:hypothetical protein